MACAQTGFAHLARDAMLAAGLSVLAKVEEHARSAVDGVTGQERGPN
jgi:hypothetical protein